MLHVGKIGPQAQQLPPFGGKGCKPVGNGCTARKDFITLASDPLPQIIEPPQSRVLTDLAWANGDGIEEFLRLGQQRGGGDQRTNPVSGQPVRFGKRVKVDERILPPVLLEQRVWRPLRLSKSR